ncbi:hypothetical protein ACFQPA_13445 [Halomarina halobia]|uniref:Cox cluster protein n=1 Tax=Halomarina halobia TaxID=3033386 RepID=A0ABD6A9C6_9EURY|nr:hypothetical protein [Halomarina sp. PSR21]
MEHPVTTTDRAAVESRWWLVVAAAAAFWVLAFAVGALAFLVGMAAFVGGFFLDPSLFLPGAFGLALLVIVPFVLLGFALAVALPVALYFDATAVRGAAVGWEPDPVLYALVAVVGLFAQGVPIQPAVAVYYLYRRHQHVGEP